jgi:hypothetical protein
MKKIFLYGGDEFSSEIKKYLDDRINKANVEVRGDFINYFSPGDAEKIACKLAEIRVMNVTKPFTYNEPLYGEIEQEKRVIDGEGSASGILYDGFKLHSIFQDMIPEEERSLDNVHIMITDRLVGTFDENDLRYHARVVVCGFPSIISTTGTVEAPAKPREFYIEKQFTGGDGLAFEEIKKKYEGRFIDYGDARMAEILKGYVMQAIFYHEFHEAFCEDKNCRLYNAHWQEEMIHAQLDEPEFCKRHEKVEYLRYNRIGKN